VKSEMCERKIVSKLVVMQNGEGSNWGCSDFVGVMR
jgi:hypothetical protein